MRIVFYEGEPCIVIPLRLFNIPALQEIANKLFRLLESFLPGQYADSNSPPLLTLKFFIDFNTVQKQDVLRQAIMSTISSVPTGTGSVFVPLYLAHSFSIGRLKLYRHYSDFFADIEALCPGMLTNIKMQEKPGDKRYKNLTGALSAGCRKWFIINGELPALNEWTLRHYVYHVNNTDRNFVQATTIKLLGLIRVISGFSG